MSEAVSWEKQPTPPQANGATVALNMMYPYPKLKVAPLAGARHPTAGATAAQAAAQSPATVPAAD